MADAALRSHPAEEILSRAHSPATTKAIFSDRVQTKPLLLRATSPDPVPKPDKTARDRRRDVRDLKRAAKASKKPRPLSAKRKRDLKIYEIPKDQRKWDIYVPIHRLWCAYMRSILGLDGEKKLSITPAGSGPVLASADYHGAIVTMVRSRCVTRVGIRGIVLKDTKYTFEVITEKNEIKTLPKEHSIFRFEIPVYREEETGSGPGKKPVVFELHGSQFETRPSDRANKKFKQHVDADA